MIKLIDILNEIQESQYKIYCDLDGVLVDFEKGYQELTGKTPPSYNTDYNEEEFWAPITKAGARFWINLDWMPDGQELWNAIKPYKPEIITAPSQDQSSRKGKYVWVRQHLDKAPLHFKPAKFKQDLAEPNAILIDDRLDTCERWRNAGGIAINHKNAQATIQILKDLGL